MIQGSFNFIENKWQLVFVNGYKENIYILKIFLNTQVYIANILGNELEDEPMIK
jgi:hypothetical protein